MPHETYACIRISGDAIALAAGARYQILVASWPAGAPGHFLSRLDELNTAYPLKHVAMANRRCKGRAMWQEALSEWCERHGIALEILDDRRTVSELARGRGLLAEARARGIQVQDELEAAAVAMLDFQLRRAALADVVAA